MAQSKKRERDGGGRCQRGVVHEPGRVGGLEKLQRAGRYSSLEPQEGALIALDF